MGEERDERGPIITPDGRHNPEAAARFLVCSVSWLAQQRRLGSGPLWFKMAGKVWYLEEALRAFVKQQQEVGGQCSRKDADAVATNGGTANIAGTTSSRPMAKSTAGALGRQVSARLRKLSAQSARASKPFRPRVVKGEA